jgi:hypothetical protein
LRERERERRNATKGKIEKKKTFFSLSLFLLHINKIVGSSSFSSSTSSPSLSPGTCSRISRSVADRRLPSLVGLSTLVMYERIMTVVVVGVGVGVAVGVAVGGRVQRTASDLVWCGMRLKPSPLNTARRGVRRQSLVVVRSRSDRARPINRKRKAELKLCCEFGVPFLWRKRTRRPGIADRQSCST